MPFDVRSLDVWGDPDGGWNINNSFKAGDLPVTVREGASDEVIVAALKDQGFLNGNVKPGDRYNQDRDDPENTVYVYLDDDLVMEVGGAPDGDTEYWVQIRAEGSQVWEDDEVFTEGVTHGEIGGGELVAYAYEEEIRATENQPHHGMQAEVGGQLVAIADVRVVERAQGGGDWPVLQVAWLEPWWGSLPMADWEILFGVRAHDYASIYSAVLRLMCVQRIGRDI